MRTINHVCHTHAYVGLEAARLAARLLEASLDGHDDDDDDGVDMWFINRMDVATLELACGAMQEQVIAGPVPDSMLDNIEQWENRWPANAEHGEAAWLALRVAERELDAALDAVADDDDDDGLYQMLLGAFGIVGGLQDVIGDMLVKDEAMAEATVEDILANPPCKATLADVAARRQWMQAKGYRRRGEPVAV